MNGCPWHWLEAFTNLTPPPEPLLCCLHSLLHHPQLTAVAAARGTARSRGGFCRLHEATPAAPHSLTQTHQPTMDFLKQLMPGGAGVQGGGASGGNSGLLADWQAYSGDVEAGGAAGTSGTSGSTTTAVLPGQLAKAAEDVGSSLSSFFRGGYAAVSDGLGSIQTPSLENTLPSGQQLVYFFSLLGGGAVFLFMAFFIGLPTLLLSPSKFALFFTLGCCFVLAGFAALKGWRSQLAAMMQRERLPFSLGYLGSIFLTLYAALIMHSYLLSLLCSGLQVVALAYYLTSHYPGGTDSVRFMLTMFGSAANSCFSSCAGLLFAK